MPERSARQLLEEWQKLMESVASAASAAGGADLPRRLVEAMRRQLEIAQDLVERERGLAAELAEALAAPVDAVFDLLEESGATLRGQAEALEAAAAALGDTAALMKRQAELFERTIGALRQPVEIARTAAGVKPRGGARRSTPPAPTRKRG